MSRREFINLAAEGISGVLRAIQIFLLDNKLRIWRPAAVRNAPVANGAAFTKRFIRPADRRSMVEERVVELRVRPRRASELIQVEADLPSAAIGPAAEAANEAAGRCVKQNSPSA